MTLAITRALAIVLSLLLLTACPVVEELTRSGQPSTGQSKVAAGLREALRIGVERTSERVGRVDGYLDNRQIRIPLPQRFQSVAEQLRRFGLGQQVDQLELAMNRAAELAAREAAAVFAQSIRQMRPSDVYAIYNGGSTAATDYLRQSTGVTLRERYRPIVAERLASVNGYEVYQDIVERWNRVPFVEPLQLDLESYVTDRAIEGVFTVLAEEEQRIRENPAARTTELLREVFGR